MTQYPEDNYEIRDFGDLSRYARKDLTINVKDMNNKFDFITSIRFWVSPVMVSASVVLIDPAFPTQAWYISLGKFLALLGTQFSIIKTVDRNFGDKQVESANINAGMSADKASMRSVDN